MPTLLTPPASQIEPSVAGGDHIPDHSNLIEFFGPVSFWWNGFLS
jgi:hypothetical protein